MTGVMPKKSRHPSQSKTVSIVLVLSIATNFYLVIHFWHLEHQPIGPLHTVAMRRLQRGANRSSADLIKPAPPDAILDLPSNTTADLPAAPSKQPADTNVSESALRPSNSTAWDLLSAALPNLLDGAAAALGRLLLPPLAARGARCPGNLSCGNFSASFSRESWNRPPPGPGAQPRSRAHLQRCRDAVAPACNSTATTALQQHCNCNSTATSSREGERDTRERERERDTRERERERERKTSPPPPPAPTRSSGMN